MTRTERCLLLVILLVAFGLRVFRLDGQSLWYDEGTSVALAGRSLSVITRSAAADIHPPLYYYLLHGWTALAGFSPTAVRSLSAAIGTLLVALTWVLGRQLFGPSVAVIAAFLAAVSPFQVYYSQEARMYILVATLGALSTVLAVRRVKQVGVAYILVTALVLYSHYFGFTVLLAQNLAIGLWVLADWRGRLRFAAWWAGAHIAVALLYAPWLVLTWRQLQAWPAVSEPFSLSFLLSDVLRVFSLGLSVPPHATPALWLFGTLLTIGLLATTLRTPQLTIHNSQFTIHNPPPRLILPLYLLIPIAAMYLLSLRRPLYNPKFLLLATPPFHILIALATCQVTGYRLQVAGLASHASHLTSHVSRFTFHASRAIAIVLLTIVTLPTVRSLHNYYFDPRYARDDYRGIARVVQTSGKAGEAVLLNAPGQIEVFDYYYDGPLPRFPLPKERPPMAENLRSELQQIVDHHERIYGILWATDESDPEGIVETWLSEHAYQAMDAWYGNVRLVVYDVPPADEQGTPVHIDARLGDQITLETATFFDRIVEAGDVLPLTLHWQTSTPLDVRYKVFVQLLGPGNQLIAQRDAEPGAGTRLTTTWRPGEPILDRYGLWVPPGTPPADYRLIAGLYHLETGQRLAVTRAGQPTGDFVELGTIQVVVPAIPPPIEALNLSARAEQDYGSVRLLGYTLDKRGAESRRDAPLFAGDTLRITLFWQVHTPPATDLALDLALVAGDQTRTHITVSPTDGLYPATRWSAGEVIRDAHDVPLPADLPPGRYRLRLTISEAGGPTLGPTVSIPIELQQR